MTNALGMYAVRDHQFELIAHRTSGRRQRALSQAAADAYAERIAVREIAAARRQKLVTRWIPWLPSLSHRTSSDGVRNSIVSAH